MIQMKQKRRKIAILFSNPVVEVSLPENAVSLILLFHPSFARSYPLFHPLARS